MIALDLATVRNYFGSGFPQMVILAKNANRQPTYIGFGTRGAATSTPNWIVEQRTYDSDGDFQTSKTSAFNSIASNYLVLEYL